MDEKSILFDCLKDQKFLASNYAQMSTEVANSRLFQDTIKICQEELRINHDIFNTLNKKGWYPVALAEQQQISQVQSKSQELQSSF